MEWNEMEWNACWTQQNSKEWNGSFQRHLYSEYVTKFLRKFLNTIG